MKAKRRGLVRTRRITNFYQRLGKDIEVEIFKIVPVSEASFKLAVNIIMEEAKTASIGSNDALHLAIVKKLPAQPIMVTLDHPMQNVCKRQTIPFFDPETVDTDSPVS
jgi:predicted nucleic acid-binding protein